MDIYNRYRPNTFKDMYNTSPFIETADRLIQNTLNKKTSATLPNFMIFYSDFAGLGKTTTGRIIAVLLNAGMDVTDSNRVFNGEQNYYFNEINAADYRKIADVRLLSKEIEFKRDSMLSINYVYMLNEAHQLTEEAQQAFLQTTENLPDNVFVIFTSTQLGSFNAKLRSRASKYEFKPLDQLELKKLLKDIAEKESKQNVPDAILDQIHNTCGFSIRESINTLGEYLSSGKVVNVDTASEVKDTTIFNTLLDKLEGVACGRVGITWSYDVIPILQKIINTFSETQVRVEMIHSLSRKLMATKGIVGEGVGTEEKTRSVLNKSNFYSKLAKRLEGDVSYPPKSFIINMIFQVYMDAKNIYINNNG